MKKDNSKEEHIIEINLMNKKSKFDLFVETIKDSLFNVLYLLLQQEDEGWQYEAFLTLIELLQLLNYPISPSVNIINIVWDFLPWR
jgi:hypothetical protein